MKKTIRDIDLRDKKVFIRCDFNVPLDEDCNIMDDGRIRSALPTISYLLGQNAAIIIASHMGRPKGKYDPKLSLKPAAERLSSLLGKQVIFISDPEVIGENSRAMAENLKPGSIMMLENIRFRPEETKNEEAFSKELASLADIYVNDAFGAAHRAHCSTSGMAAYLPAVSGLLMEKEINIFDEILTAPKKPYTAVLGGSKVSDKIPLIENLLDRVDTVLIGGGMSFTFLKACGYEIGTSLLDTESLELSINIMKKAEQAGVKLVLPVDAVCADEFRGDSPCDVYSIENMPSDRMGLDVGPATREIFRNKIIESATIVWNGPMGVFEMERFAAGTRAVAQAMCDSTGITVIGGGDSASAIRQFGLEEGITHISTGGGASLEFLEGKVLPGVDCLEDKE